MVSDLDRAVLVVVSPGYESWFRRAGAASAIMLVLGPGEQRMRKYCSAFSLCLLAPGAAWADGGIGALGGVLDMFLLMTGAGGLFIVLLMFSIIGAQKDQPGTSIGTRIGIAFSVAYVFLAAFFFAASSESPFWLVPAFTGGGTIALLIVYTYRLKDDPAE